jgi:hypothetical protein
VNAAAASSLPLTWGRRIALLAGVPVVLFLIACNSFNLVAHMGTAGYPVNYDIPVRGQALTMNLGGGDATVRGGAAASLARVSGTVTYSLLRPAIHLTSTGTGSDLGIDCPAMDNVSGTCHFSGTVTVGLPSRTALNLATGGGSMSISGITANATLSTDGGTLSLADVAGGLTLRTGGGDLRATHVGGTLTMNTSGGTVDATAIDAGQVTADTGGGDITLRFGTVPRNLQVTSNGGNVTIIVPPGGRYNVASNADGGNVTGSLPGGADAPDVIDVTSGGGNITFSQSA